MTELNIKTVGGNGTFDDVIGESSEEIQAICHALRVLIADVLPGVTEFPWAQQKIAGYGVGPKKMSEHFSYIGLKTKHVNLGFMYGADLNDPDNLLEGTGKALRHIKIKSLTDVEKPAIRDLLERASQHLPKLKYN